MHHLKLLDLLGERFGIVLVPPAVALELSKPHANFVSINVELFSCFQIQAPLDAEKVSTLEESLDAGESQAIALAVEVHADYLLIDEADGRAIAMQMGIQTTGVLGILLRAKETGRIGLIEPLLNELESGLRFFLSSALRGRVLKQAGEG